jgi:hypothetical protein
MRRGTYHAFIIPLLLLLDRTFLLLSYPTHITLTPLFLPFPPSRSFQPTSQSNNPPSSFTLTRTPQHLDTSYISGQIRNLVASTPTPYTGTLSITFPSTHSTLVIAKTAPPKNWFEKLVGPKLKSREYKPVESVWPFATAPPGTSAAMGMGMGRECAVQNEGEWWGVWEGAIRAGVVGRRKGWVGVEEWVEGAMGGSASESGKGEGGGS